MDITDGPSYLRNCFIRTRNDEAVFRVSPDSKFVVAMLDGYTIVPTEEYGKQLPMKPLALRAGTAPSQGHQASSWRETAELEGEIARLEGKIAELGKTVAAYEVLYPLALKALDAARAGR